MRVRFLVAATLGATSLLVPFAATAHAVTTNATELVFTADPDGNGVWTMYERLADGSDAPAPLFVTSHDIGTYALSPDGTKVVYADATTAGGDYSLWVR